MAFQIDENPEQRSLLVYHRVGTRDYLVEILSADEAVELGSQIVEAGKRLVALQPSSAAVAHAAARA